ncbi:uncharacterized protein LOC105174747 isoform X2 [Sesamum indicum]|uniref:Uncharacterized protein LOC105174747 isoform X2 n=1 Tax=Sesamum indicum TaxID=4182 RepID=A0A6I9U413_SESIN|nr:uncharacterized protein LOC105174747 isoform X2 [Sesamum indicum]
MEELFQYMKTLRSQINDVADQAAKLSVEEHMLFTTVETLQKDLDLVKNETRQVKEETDQMTKAKGKIYSQILQNQRKIASLESDSSTLSQTLKLMQQEKLCLSAKLVDQSTYYEKVGQDISAQLTEHQEWINAQDFGSRPREVNEKAGGTKEFPNDVGQSLTKDFQAAQANFGKMEKLKSDLALKNTKLRQSVELVKTKMTEFKSELRDMDEKSLEEDLQALLSDKSGEAEYVQSLQLQITRVKEISHIVRCSCGEEYNVKLDK